MSFSLVALCGVFPVLETKFLTWLMLRGRSEQLFVRGHIRLWWSSKQLSMIWNSDVVVNWINLTILVVDCSCNGE